MNELSLQQKWLATASGKICYFLRQESANRPTAVLLHGLSSNHTTWLGIMKALSENGYNSLAPDLRGHGFSDKTKTKEFYRLSVFSDDLNKILKQEQIKDFVLVGYSFGGQIAIDYAARYQDSIRGLVLISANIAPPLKYPRLGFFTSLVVAGLNLLAALLFWQKRRNYHYYQHGRAAGYWDSVWDGLRTMPVSVNFWLLAQVFKIDLMKSLQQIKIPSVLVYGRNDVYITPKEINDTAKALPQAQLIISKNPGHFVGTNSQNETAQIILSFLRKL
ncbi:alpha/beta hydrolase [Patescibacteria group bacterium]|nr:alpha/beta hydrolase [Patescibacteria group bacterium]